MIKLIQSGDLEDKIRLSIITSMYKVGRPNNKNSKTDKNWRAKILDRKRWSEIC